MSLFVNLSKFLTGYFSKGLTTPIATATAPANEVAELGSGFTRWRTTYERFCRRKSKHNMLMTRASSSKMSCKPSLSSGVQRRRSSLRLRYDKKGFNTASMLSNMRLARLFSLNTPQASRQEQQQQQHLQIAITPTTTPTTSTVTTKHRKIAAGLPKKNRSIGVLPQHQSVRTKCGRENCADPCDWPLCPPFNQRWPSGENKLHNIYEAYWDDKNDRCCDDPCKWAYTHTRFDDLYLKESDKAKRRYMRTWTECPMRIKQKRICCYDGEPPEICFRPKKERPHTACPPEPLICDGADKRCQKIKLPCCCDVRNPQKCKPLTRSLMNCKKFCTPYPAFSECIKAKGKPRHGQECPCLNPIPMCEYWVYWRKRILSRSGEKC